jgi:serine/threonine-protein kinase HipA
MKLSVCMEGREVAVLEQVGNFKGVLVYDFLTTSVYAGYQHNPPGISFLGKRTWAPGKTLSRFIATTFGIAPKAQSVMLESIYDAMAEVVPEVRARMEDLPAFRETGKRMLLAWKDGVDGLRSQ